MRELWERILLVLNFLVLSLFQVFLTPFENFIKLFPQGFAFSNKGITFNLYVTSIMKFRRSVYQVSTTFFWWALFDLWVKTEGKM